MQGLLRLVVFFYLLSLAHKAQAYNWWMWTPGDHVDNSTQSSLVKGYHPDQPIPFDHKLHVTDRKIPCEYCHSAARRSIAGGIPPLNTCMGCHKFVNTDTESIKKITEAYKNNTPMEWVKVNALPDYVRFSHQVHVNAKDTNGASLLNCQTCHGPVETMKTVEQFAPLQMGWCLECHNRVKDPGGPGIKPVTNAPVTCNTCHF